MNVQFINAMVQHMYAFEAHMPGSYVLLTDQEIADLYHSYCGGFCPLTTI